METICLFAILIEDGWWLFMMVNSDHSWWLTKIWRFPKSQGYPQSSSILVSAYLWYLCLVPKPIDQTRCCRPIFGVQSPPVDHLHLRRLGPSGSGFLGVQQGPQRGHLPTLCLLGWCHRKSDGNGKLWLVYSDTPIISFGYGWSTNDHGPIEMDDI